MRSEESLVAERALEEKLAGVPVRRGGTASLETTPEPTPSEETPPAPEPVAEQVAETAPEPVAEEPAQEPTGDPVAAAVLAKYGNDPAKLAQAHAALQQRLGEQGNELGEQRRQAQEYEQILAQLEELKQERQQPPMPGVDWIDEQIAANPHDAQRYALQALNSNQPLLYERIMRQWYEHDLYAANNFENTVRIEQAKRELQAQAPQRNESIELQAALNEVVANNREFAFYTEEQLTSVMNQYPLVAAALTGDQEQKQQAILTLYKLAEHEKLKAAALIGGTPAEPATTQEVAASTTSQEHPHEAPAAPTGEELFREQFRQVAASRQGERVVPRALQPPHVAS